MTAQNQMIDEPKGTLPDAGPQIEKTWLEAAQKNLLVLGAGIFCLLAGEFIKTRDLGLDWLVKLLHEMGMAAVISFIVIVSIEYKARKEQVKTVQHFMKEINKIVNESNKSQNEQVENFIKRVGNNIFDALFDVRMPKDMFEFMEDRLIRQPFYRLGTELHLTLKTFPRQESGLDQDLLLAEINLSFNVENISRKEETYPLVLSFAQRTPLAPGLVVPKDLCKAQFCIENVPLPPEEMQLAYDRIPNVDDFITYRHDIKLQPEECRSITVCYTMLKLQTDTEVWRGRLPGDGLITTVSYPDGFEVTIAGVHPEADELEPASRGSGFVKKRWRRPFFPSNGCQIWWHPVVKAGNA